MSELTLPGPEDYRRYDRIWRRVSPELDPYPEARAQNEAAPDGPARQTPCCLGGTERDVETVRAFLREELADAQVCRQLAKLAPTQAGRRLMQSLAAEEAGHARTLQSVHFLATGGTYPVTVVLPPQPKLLWRDRLRGRWHDEVCGGARYAEAAARTPDPCLRGILQKLSADEYRHAEQLRRALEREL